MGELDRGFVQVWQG